MKCKHSTDFTLVEMLVVISILVILAALLLPALTQTREKCKQAVCLSNLKQQGLDLITIAGDSGGFLPYSYVSAQFISSTSNIYKWSEYWTYASLLYRADYAPVLNIFECPSSHNDPVCVFEGESTSGTEGAARRSYLANYNLMQYSNAAAPWGKLCNLATLSSQKITIVEGFFNTTTANGGEVAHYVGTVKGGSWWYATVYDWNYPKPAMRHQGGSNAFFVDGHAEWRNDLWSNKYLW